MTSLFFFRGSASALPSLCPGPLVQSTMGKGYLIDKELLTTVKTVLRYYHNAMK